MNNACRPTARAHPTRPKAGLTFIELIIAVVILGVLVAVGVPSMQEFIAKRRVQAAADELLTDLRLTRSIVMGSNKPVQMRVVTSSAMTCYVISDRIAFAGECNCLNVDAPVCVPPLKEHKSVRFPSAGPVRVQVVPGSRSMVVLDSMLANPNGNFNLRVSAANGGAIRVSTNSAFVPTACSESGQHIGYPTCP